MSQTTLCPDDSTDKSNGWTDNSETQDWVNPNPKAIGSSNLFNIICGMKVTRTIAQSVLEKLQFMHGTMSMSLESIEEFELTEPLAVDDSNEYAGGGEEYENGRIWRAIASFSTNPQLKATVRAKQAVASAHVYLHENFLLWGAMVPISVAVSMWNKVHYALDSYDFRDCRNFFSHVFLRTEYGNDLRYYKQVEKLYTSTVPVLEALIEKLQIGLADESAWKTEESELSYSDGPEYALDTPEAEAEAEEQRRIKASELSVSTAQCSWVVEEEASESVHESPEGPSAVDPIAAWLEDTLDWKSDYEIIRRQSWSHFYVDAYGTNWM
jgi:hypothetical protein